ncbi:phosphodiester glycosidase family protein [Desulfosporosinus youngiae]|uniref:Exopolysaccharide biosynthesis protein n=1 Tax=Desulfosporosinus youngiae DSM 17734 TaxID=768710 RepID=H5XVX1_9FIRM|nr:phosphodiester glycosidase family protein [Desulfosporosinus youngiae]EHQ90423.1 exopolysaccharide biosynthesis protein [Desulfosporosinus youngiae DSM 17734]
MSIANERIKRFNKKRGKFKPKLLILFIIFQILFPMLMAPFIIFYGPFDTLRSLAVGTVYTSRHPQYLRFFLAQEEIEKIIGQSNQSLGGDIENTNRSNAVNLASGIVVEDINGQNALGKFHGKVMLIKDPKRIKVAVTKDIGVNGNRLSDLVKNIGAIAGINGGGFYDPDGIGNGALPDGLTVHNGELVHNNVEDNAVNIIGLDKEGHLILGNMSSTQIREKGIQEAVHFEPNLIVDGKRADFTDGPYGYAPRTAIGQKADGTIIFVVIDGRQPTWSMGAGMSDVYNIFKKYDAVTAANLDGGSSSEMVYDGKVLNKLWNIFGERYISTGFVVMP